MVKNSKPKNDDFRISNLTPEPRPGPSNISHNFDLTQISQDFDFNLTPTQIQGPRPGLSNMAQIISHCSFQDDFDLTLT